ncbi:putative LysR family transcriptional regulator [Nocardia brasiliensis NBRC 14402]|uniref:LysR family transcriptional regulator n=1 Tax=Nocardia brasiliensis TaxID=37326 RepID=UPI0002F57CBB|nr:LysR family transcriptional regulator [Nocardia brasiliensis]ASF08139.1 LysR family transcriptional regulator [Nocardia brasiliensis]GAJ79902.1 putative LysR family transcriptional regulator [Nocardia brasiliensis NBRC 14402]SUB54205.1 D-malate degradation protein R [Nocardia brasiliensis]
MYGASTDDVTFFDIVARSRSLTEAAREFGISVSSVSKRLAQMEARLGVVLVQRSTRRLTLTPEGERYAAGAAVIAAQLEELEDSIAEQRHDLRGRVHLRSTIGLGRAHIAPLVADFVERHPSVQVDLELSALPLNIAGTGYDVAIRVGTLQDSRLTATRLWVNRRVVCAAPEYVRRHGMPATVKELAEHNCIILRENESDYALWRFESAGKELAVRVAGNLISNDGDVITRWCLEGRGLVMRSRWHVDPLLKDGSLVQVLPELETPPADIYAVYAAAAPLPRRTRAVIDHLKAGLGRRITAAAGGPGPRGTSNAAR